MGVPKFYRWISERYPCLSETVKDHQIPEFDNLYLDMNGIVHVCSHPDDGNPHFRITEEKIFADIFHYLEVLFRMIKPRKVFFMAIDGVAPRAKMNQQRGRRFRSAKEAETLETKAKSRGETLPTEARFDSNCITPGTPFMDRLHKQLQYFVVSKISTDKLWQGVTVYLSGHETPGEGEHKIMDFIRSEKARPDYDSNTRHCLYGLDADLIMLGLTTHEPHFALLREEVRFGKQTQKRSNTVEETTFHLLHISLLREYLDLEFQSIKPNLISFNYDLERIIDDWVLMGFLVGNDFIPHLPHLHIAQDALPTIWSTYKKVLPSLGGYLNDKGQISLHRLEIFLKELSEWELERFSEGYADMKWMDGKVSSARAFGKGKGARNRRGNREEPAAVDDLDDFNDPEENGFMGTELAKAFVPERMENEDSMSYEFRKHKSCYYFEKMDLQATSEVLEEQAKGYVLGLQWILHYYYTGVPSWGWFFPHHYAPYLSDLHSFSHVDIVLDPGQPFLPFQQLMAVLPAASKALLPEAYQPLMLSDNSPIIDFYPQEFESDLNGKQQDWEAVVLIPFINEDTLISAMKSVEHRLTAEEISRNKHGPCLIYKYSEESQGVYKSLLPDFPDIAHNHSVLTTKNWQDFVVTLEQLRAGLCADVKPTLYYPGFPTFAHIKIKSYLQKMGVTVFQQASRNENRIVQILDDMDIDNIDLMELGKSLLGESIWVNWPHMFEAKVHSIETDEEKVELSKADPSQIVKSSNGDNAQVIFKSLSESIADRMEKKRGVDIGPTFVLVHAQPISGRKYVYLKDGRVTIDKEWQKTTVPFALQACVKNEKMLQFGVESTGSVQFFNLQDVFPVGSKVYILAHPYYGCQAEVVSHVESRVRVKVHQQPEPNLRPAIEFKESARYMKAYELAQHLGVSSHFISRITGTMFLMNGKESLNIGLDLKNNKKNEECPGFTRKEGADWLYSQTTEDVIYDYLEQFPTFCQYMHDNLNKDKNSAENAFSNSEGAETCEQLMTYVKSLPTYNCLRAKCGNEFLESSTIAIIEKLVDKNAVKIKQQVMTIKPSLIYKRYSMTSTMMPDSDVDFELFDRVVNVRMGYTVPYGLRGTVIGVIKAQDSRDTQIEVLFDTCFPCGLTTRCTPGKGYRCPPHSLINVTHGSRMAAIKGYVSANSKKLSNSTQPPRASPQNRQTRSYSGIVNARNSSPSANANKNTSGNASPSQPQMTVLKRPDSSKPKPASARGDKPHASTESKLSAGGSNAVPASKGKGSPSPQAFNKVNSQPKGKTVSPAPNKAKGGKPVAMQASMEILPSSSLMTPSEFVTPKTQKLDGRQRPNEKLNHAAIWSKLKAEAAKEANVKQGAGDAAKLADSNPNLTQALQALKNIQPPNAAPTHKNIQIQKIAIDESEIASVPKAGEKIDIESLLGGKMNTSTDSTPSQPMGSKKEKRQTNREFYVAHKNSPGNSVPNSAFKEERKKESKSGGTSPAGGAAVEARKPAVAPSDNQSSGGFDFQLLVSALEQNMSDLSLDRSAAEVSKSAEVKSQEKQPESERDTDQEKTTDSGTPQPSGAPQALHQPSQHSPSQPQQQIPQQPLQQSPYKPRFLAQRLPQQQYFAPPQAQVQGVMYQPPRHEQHRMMAMHQLLPNAALLQWTQMMGLPQPVYDLAHVQTMEGVVLQATVFVGGLKFLGGFTFDNNVAVQSAAKQALENIKMLQHGNKRQQMNPAMVRQPNSASNTLPPAASAMPPSNDSSPFVPMQVMRKKAQDATTKSKPKPPAPSETVAPVTIHAEAKADSNAVTKKQVTKGSHTKSKNSQPKRTSGRSRLAINFDNAEQT